MGNKGGNQINEEKSSESSVLSESSLSESCDEEFKKYIFIKFKNKVSKSSLQNFIDNPSEINKDNLKDLLNLINKDIQNKIYYFIPFLKIPNLIKLYIESDLDEVEEKEEYYKIFEELKKHVFINRNCLSPIYEYFSDILYNIKNIQKIDKKFLKVHRLWKIFYNNNIKENKEHSSFCFNGGYLKLVPLNKYFENYLKDNEDEKYILTISINFNKYLIKEEINECLKIIFIKIKDVENFIEVNPENNIKGCDIKKIEIKIFENNINIYFDEKYCYKLEKENIKLENIERIYLLNDFYGEIDQIVISIDLQKTFSSQNINKQIYKPFGESEEKNKIFKIQCSNRCRKNLINYLDKDFNILEYFGGLKPLIPFVSLINEIYDNQITLYNREDKNRYLQEFISDIFSVLNQYNCNLKNHQIINEIKGENIINENDNSIHDNELEKIIIFFLYLLFHSEIIPKENILNIIRDLEDKKNDKVMNIGDEINNNNNGVKNFKEIKKFITNNENNIIIK